MRKSSKDQRFHSYLSPVAAKVYWRIRLIKDVTPEAALMETIHKLEDEFALRPEDIICDTKGVPIGVVPLAER